MISIWNKLKDRLDMDSAFVSLFKKYYIYDKEELMHPKLFKQRHIEKAISSYKPGDFNKIYDAIPDYQKNKSTPIINLFLLKMIFNGRITVNDDHLYIYMFDKEKKDVNNFLRLFEIVDRDLDLEKLRSLFHSFYKIKTHENNFLALHFLWLLNNDSISFNNAVVISRLVKNLSILIVDKKHFNECDQLAIDSLIHNHYLFPENYSNPPIDNDQFKNKLTTHLMLNMSLKDCLNEIQMYKPKTEPMISENISIL